MPALNFRAEFADALPLCACVQYYDSHHPECPARRAYEAALLKLGRLRPSCDYIAAWDAEFDNRARL